MGLDDYVRSPVAKQLGGNFPKNRTSDTLLKEPMDSCAECMYALARYVASMLPRNAAAQESV